MEAARDRLAEAQARGDVPAIRAALADSLAAGADAKQIEAAMGEVNRMEQQQQRQQQLLQQQQQVGGGATASEAAPGGGEAPTEADAAAEAENAAKLRAIAEECKKKGNEFIKEGTKSAARKAMEAFTGGLDIRCSDNVLNAQLYGNRAHVRMLLRQFVEAVDDCRKAVELDPQNVKAYWRAAKASMHLDLCRNGIEFCEAGLERAPQDVELAKLRDTCVEKLATQQERKTQLAKQQRPAGAFQADEVMAVQDQVNGLAEQLQGLQQTLGARQHKHNVSQRTRAALDQTPEDARLYTSVGRCFMVQDRKVILDDLATTVEELETEIPGLQKAGQELAKRKASAEKEFQEMIQACQQRQQTTGSAAA